MASLRTNPLLPVIATVVVVVAGFIAYLGGNKSDGITDVDSQDRVKIGRPVEADADSTSDTITALSGIVSGFSETVESVKNHNQQLIAEKEALVVSTEERIEEIERAIDDEISQKAALNEAALSEIMSKMTAMEDMIVSLETELEERDTRLSGLSIKERDGSDELASESKFSPLSEMIKDSLASGGDEIEVVQGLGLDQFVASQGTDTGDLVWIDPLDRSIGAALTNDTDRTAAERIELSRNRGGLFPDAQDMRADLVRAKSKAEPQPQPENPIIDTGPRYTIPDLSMMTGAVSLTAIVGRVYLDDEIVDPWPFKVQIGRNNLTANRQQLPDEIDGMLFEGYGVGDWTLGCVRGWLTVASFVFSDGTVSPAYSNSPGTREVSNRINPDALGYISDPYGNPCVLGEKVTNAAGYLAGRTLAAAATGYANALNSDNVITKTTSDTSNTVSTVQQVLNTSGSYAAREAYAESFAEGARWIRERQGQSFDAVYVPSSTEVVVNLQMELRLDKRPDSRKIIFNSIKGIQHESLD